MNLVFENFTDMKTCAFRSICILAALFSLPLDAAENSKTFTTPEEAVSALISATATKDTETLHALFGPAGKELANPDRVQGTNELNAFTEAFYQTNRLARLSDSNYVLEVGTDLWPFP